MSSDFSNDPRFNELPQWAQNELKDVPPTGMMGENTWHEVSFRAQGFNVQCAVVNRKWVPFSKSEIEAFSAINKVYPPQ